MLSCFILINIMIYFHQDNIIVALILIFLLTYQCSSGPLKVVHVYETCVDSSAGFSLCILYGTSVFCAILTDLIIKYFGVQEMFLFFTFTQINYFFYVRIFWKDTTFYDKKIILENGEVGI